MTDLATRADVDLRQRLARDLPWLLAVTSLAVWLPDVLRSVRPLGYDAHAYWLAWQGGPVYDKAPETIDAYLYSPAFAQAVWPLAQLPWPVFFGVWAVVMLAAFWHLFAPLGWQRALPLTLACAPEVLNGNVYALFALVAAYGLRYPALWAFPALTKVTPAVGAVWFLARGEWRQLGLAVGSTLLVVAASFALAPGLWADWLYLLTTSQVDAAAGEVRIPIWVKAIPALLLVVWGARTDRRWVVPVAMVLACPVWGFSTFTILAALPRLRADARHRRSGVHAAAGSA